MPNIKMDAHNSAVEPYRIERLQSVDFWLKENYPPARLNISSLYDCQGTLTVTWHSPPSDKMRYAAEIAWEFQNEHTVRHEVATCQ
jgi:hypothetical protein